MSMDVLTTREGDLIDCESVLHKVEGAHDPTSSIYEVDAVTVEGARVRWCDSLK